jgi:hypothetical protein
MRSSRDEGTTSVIVLALLALSAMACLAVADAANVLLARARASAAADATALAAVAEQWKFLGLGNDPVGAATRMAESNGATLDLCRCSAGAETATVEVSVPTRLRMLRTAPARVHASATARVDRGALFRPPP